MATTGTTVLNNLMRQTLAPKVVESFHNDPILLMILDDINSRRVNAKGEDIAIRTRPSPSFGALGESSLLPEAGAPSWAKFNILNKLHYAQGEISGLVHLMQDIDTIPGGKAKVKEVGGMLAYMIDKETDDFKRKLNQLAYGTGNGALGSPITAITTGAGGTFTINPAASHNGADFIPLGAQIQFYTVAGVIHDQTGAVPFSRVTGTNYATGVITCDNIPTNAVVGDIVVYKDSYGNSMNGLRGLIQDSNITFQGVNVTNEPNLKGNVHDAASGNWSQQAIDRMLTRTKIRAGINRPVNDFVILTHPVQSDAVRNAGYALNSVTTGSDRAAGKLDLGFPLISTNGMRIREDVDCGKGDMFGFRLSNLIRYALKEPGLMEIIDGHMLAPKPGNGNYYHIQQYAFCFIGNLATQDPASNWYIRNLAYSGLG